MIKLTVIKGELLMTHEKNKINLYENNNQILNAAIDRIVVELFNKKNTLTKAQSIIFTGCSPLVGTTSTCIALGIAIATSKRKTLIVDCDVRKSIKYKKLNEKTTKGLANFLLDENTSIDEVVYETNIDNLEYMPCGDYLENSTRILCSERMEQLIESFKDRYDNIIFDFPSLTIVPDAQILFKSVDGIVLLAALGETRKKQIKEAKLIIKPFSEKYFGMIVNKIPIEMYRFNVRDYDYYFVDKKGEQKLSENDAYKQFKKKKNRKGEK